MSVLSTVTNTITATIPVGGRPSGFAVSPDGHHVFVTTMSAAANFTDPGTVAVIDTSTNTVTATIAVGVWPQAATISPDGKHLYVINFLGPGDTQLDPSTLSVIDTTTNTLTHTISLGSSAIGLALSPDGRYLYTAVDGSLAVVAVPGSAVNGAPTET